MPTAAVDISHAATSRRAASASPQPAATPAPPTMRVTHRHAQRSEPQGQCTWSARRTQQTADSRQ
eukprot:372313-Prymnesium_polylepis.1